MFVSNWKYLWFQVR